MQATTRHRLRRRLFVQQGNTLKAESFDRKARERGLAYERLDQLTVEVLLASVKFSWHAIDVIRYNSTIACWHQN
jgi:hypothetical protein